MVNHQARAGSDAALLWWRWSWRDFRGHWTAVMAIALVMAIGVGVYAGLGSTSTWRRLSNDESFEALAMHDLRIKMSPGTFVEEGSLASTVMNGEAGPSILAVNERLVVDNQVEASTEAHSILVVARLVGMDLDQAATQGIDAGVDRLWVRDGPVGDGEAVLEAKFADAWDLPPSGTLILAGNQRVDYVGLGMSPEDFYYAGPEGSLLSQGELAPVYLSLDAAQQVAGRPNQVNDLVVRLVDGADRKTVERQLTANLEELGVSASISTREDADAFRVLYEDIENDQQFWNGMAGLILAAAALAAFNLISRIVEAQRREIGIGMALGVPRWKLAVRPLLVGVQVAVLGTAGGVGVGLVVGVAMQDLLRSFLPLPEYRTPFQFTVFARAALLGLSIPVLACVFPLWRAVRVEPIEAIRSGHLAARRSRLTDWTGRLRLPGSSLTQIPIRSILRTPRRTFLTAASVGAAIAALVAVLGMLDSFGRTIDQAGAEVTKGSPDRVLVLLDTFYPEDSSTVTAIGAAPSVGAIDVGLRIPALARGRREGDDLELLVELVDLGAAKWTPTVKTSLSNNPTRGIILAQKAADDLGVTVGERLWWRHLVQTAPGAFESTESTVEVTGIHANPLRAFAYMDIESADLFGLAGQTNLIHAYPAPDASRSDIQRDVFGLSGVSSCQAVARISEGFDKALAQFVGILVIAAAAVLILALLIAFNATRITMDERRREHATMRAFGLPVHTIIGLVVKESVLVGLMATVIGIGAGLAFLGWMLRSVAETTLPDIGITAYLSPTTLASAAVVGVFAVTAAPLFLTHRLQRMDVPDTLRIME